MPGDECVGGFSPAAEKLIDLDEKCAEGNKDFILEEVKPEYINDVSSYPFWSPINFKY